MGHQDHLEREMTLKTNKLRDAITFALAVGATTLAGTGLAFAQDTAADKKATDLDKITVTGTRIRAVEGETTSPVLTITRQQLEATGLTSVGDVLFNITSSDGGALRNITTSTNGSDGTQNISLRGLGATRTLILVNGRRWLTQGDGTVDLNTIPISIVERIEVLKDGASAIYGSDAIAGVINVITRKDYEGAEAHAYYGSYAKGDGVTQAYDFTVGANGDRWNTVFSIGYTDNTPVYMGDRAFSRVPLIGAGDYASGGLFGSSYTPNGRFNVCTGAVSTTPQGFQTCTAGATTTYDPTAPGGYRPWVSYTLDNSGSSDRYNFAPINYLLQPIERINLFGSASLQLTDNVAAHVMATYVRRKSDQQLAQVPASLDIRGSLGPQWAFAPTADNVFNPYGAQIRTMGFRMIASGPRNPHYTNDNLATTLWLDGSFNIGSRSMYWDVGYSYMDSHMSTRGFGYINLFNLKKALGRSIRNGAGQLQCLDAAGNVIAGCVPFNMFNGPDLGLAAGVISPEEYKAMVNYVTYTQSSTWDNTMKDYFADLSGDIFDLPAGPLAYAVGAEYRQLSYYNQPDSLVASGGSSDNFQEPTRGAMDIKEYYAELNVPILADVFLAKNLELNVAARRSDYNVNGFVGINQNSNSYGDTSKKYGIKWQITDEVMLRGTYSESFRAPSLTDLYQGGTESFPSATDPCNTANYNATTTDQAKCQANGVPVGGAPQSNTQIRSLVGGNPTLLPEFGTTKSFGVVYSPKWLEGLDVTLDWYNIKLKDALATRSAQSILNLCYRNVGATGGATSATEQAFYCGFVSRNADGTLDVVRQTNFNLQAAEVEGYDFTVAYRLPETSFGNFRVQWDSTYQTKNDLFGVPGLYNGTPTFRLRSNVSVMWTKGDWDATWTARYYSALTEACPINDSYYFAIGITPQRICSDKLDANGNVMGQVHRLGASVFHDLQVGWKTPWNGRIAVGGRNIFGRNPPKALNSFAGGFDAAYDLPGGGFYYVQYTQKF